MKFFCSSDVAKEEFFFKYFKFLGVSFSLNSFFLYAHA